MVHVFQSRQPFLTGAVRRYNGLDPGPCAGDGGCLPRAPVRGQQNYPGASAARKLDLVLLTGGTSCSEVHKNQQRNHGVSATAP
jgi:hypothetical protein